MLTAQRLDLLPRHAIVVNVARGALVDEEALADRLARGRLRGAVLDVFQEEPLATDSPLWQLRSTLVTPHVSPVSPGRFWERELDLFLENWRRYRSGEPLRNVVDKHAGY
jgi:phosphoglycerate dehydrogenase-like enzyme